MLGFSHGDHFLLLEEVRVIEEKDHLWSANNQAIIVNYDRS